MSSSNYIKCVDAEGHHVIITFPPEDIARAWQALQTEINPGDRVSIWQPALFAGPWDQLPIIGHRSRDAIMADISVATAEEIDALYEELAAVPFSGGGN